MGRNHRKVWVGKNCVLCGGNRSAESVEHAPPKVMFLDQTRPKGFEFPACKRCNKGSAEYDQLAAYVAYSQAPDAVQCSAPITNSQKTLVEGFANNSPFPYKQAQRVLIDDSSAQAWTTACHVEFTEKAAKDIAKWSAKQSLALWYEHTNKIASHNTIVDIALLTNSMVPDIEMDRAIRMLGPSISMSTKGNFVGKNFAYKFCGNTKEDLAIMFAQYHGGFAFLGIVKDKPSAKLSRIGLQFKFTTNAYKGIHEVS